MRHASPWPHADDADSDPLAPRLLTRPERPGDADAVHRVHDAAFGGPIESRIVDEMRGTECAADERWSILVIGPVGVRPDEQGRGIGSALMRAAIAAAGERDESLICLVGHAGYYPRFGFEPARGVGIQPPHPWPDENWLALRLPAWTPALRGTARFPPAFPDG